MIGLLFIVVVLFFMVHTMIFGPPSSPSRSSNWDMIEIATISPTKRPRTIAVEPKKTRVVQAPPKAAPAPTPKVAPTPKSSSTPKVAPAPKVKATPTPKAKVEVFSHPLYDDCVEVLVGLGEKRNFAIKNAQQILNSHDIKTLEEFILTAYSKI